MMCNVCSRASPRYTPASEQISNYRRMAVTPLNMLFRVVQLCSRFECRAVVVQDSIRSSAFYVPPQAKIPVSQKQPTTMRRGGGGSGVLTPGQAPPDLPSLLLDSRIVFIGMPLVASVTELIVSELLWLNYNQPEKPVYMYINSLGSQKEQQAVGFETEAYAILDTMNVRRHETCVLLLPCIPDITQRSFSSSFSRLDEECLATSCEWQCFAVHQARCSDPGYWPSIWERLHDPGRGPKGQACCAATCTHQDGNSTHQPLFWQDDGHHGQGQRARGKHRYVPEVPLRLHWC